MPETIKVPGATQLLLEAVIGGERISLTFPRLLRAPAP